jgi:flagellar biosynthesis anti-sigma factor FlgM
MRIDLNSDAAISGSHIERAQSSTVAPGGAARSEQAQISESHASVGKLATVALSALEVRTDKVQALESKLRSGTYNVSSAQIAGSMLEQMRVRSSQ